MASAGVVPLPSQSADGRQPRCVELSLAAQLGLQYGRVRPAPRLHPAPDGSEPTMTLYRDRLDPVRRFGLAAGALALLLQVVSWAWMPAGSGGANASAPAIGGESLVICTPEGFTKVAFGGLGSAAAELGAKAGTAGKQTGGTGPDSHDCPLCPLVVGLAMATMQPDVFPAEFGRRGSRVFWQGRVAAGRFPSTPQARAPPVFG